MIIRKGSNLYRASASIEEVPSVRLYEDIGKVGVYFSAYDPYLAETMVLEYKKELYISVYAVVEDIYVNIGKYRYRDNILKNNMSCIDFNVYPKDNNVKYIADSYGELFLVENDIRKIKYINYYKMNVEEVKNIYY